MVRRVYSGRRLDHRRRENYESPEYQDTVEAQALYNVLENEVIPLFFSRSADKLPRAWIQRMKACVRWVAPRFNTHRMLAQYTRRFYCPGGGALSLSHR